MHLACIAPLVMNMVWQARVLNLEGCSCLVTMDPMTCNNASLVPCSFGEPSGSLQGTTRLYAPIPRQVTKCVYHELTHMVQT